MPSTQSKRNPQRDRNLLHQIVRWAIICTASYFVLFACFSAYVNAVYKPEIALVLLKLLSAFGVFALHYLVPFAELAVLLLIADWLNERYKGEQTSDGRVSMPQFTRLVLLAVFGFAIALRTSGGGDFATIFMVLIAAGAGVAGGYYFANKRKEKR